MSDKPVAYFIGALNAFTTSQAEAEKEATKYPVEALYSASDYEALNKQLEIQVKKAYQLILDVVYLKKQNEALKKQVEEHKEWHMKRDEMRKALEAQMTGDSK